MTPHTQKRTDKMEGMALTTFSRAAAARTQADRQRPVRGPRGVRGQAPAAGNAREWLGMGKGMCREWPGMAGNGVIVRELGATLV